MPSHEIHKIEMINYIGLLRFRANANFDIIFWYQLQKIERKNSILVHKNIYFYLLTYCVYVYFYP